LTIKLNQSMQNYPSAPLAERMRPTDLKHIVGQSHLVGEGSILYNSIQQGKIPSMILWGPPGTGKTTLANVIANTLSLPFFSLSAISAGVKDMREILELAKKTQHAILFIDEIHRFNKSQQDALLNAVEKGTVTLIGATTENPSFEVNSALLSRCMVYVLKSLNPEEQITLMKDVLLRDEWMQQFTVHLKETAALIQIAGGDARKLLNLLELVVVSLGQKNPEVEITDRAVMQIAQQKVMVYDKNGEQHYDIISAFIKSIRGSDPNGAVYWLGRMLAGGEDIKFIARRMVISASEDIGNANPTALILANSTFDAVNKIGNPEARIILSQCAIYLATSAKSNASYTAINDALSLIRKTGDLPVPLHLRNAPTKLMKQLDYGKDYQYAHNFENNFVNQEFLPETISGTSFFVPGKNAREEEMRKYLQQLWGKKYNY
jgi:putative ATPase